MSDQSLPKTPGELISEAREAQGLTIAHLSERTKIPPPVLASLELDEFHKISGPLYIKSFLRTCALDLGLDPQTVLNQYNKFSGEKKNGPVGKEMVWREDDVKVTRVGLPWLRIILGVGLAAVVIGLGLFALRGCGQEPTSPGEGQSGIIDPAEPNEKMTAIVPGDSVSEDESRRESLIPSSTETQLRQRAAAMEESGFGRYAVHDSARYLPDSLAVGWLLNPAPVNGEKEVVSPYRLGDAQESRGGFSEETTTFEDDQKQAESLEESSEETPEELTEESPGESTGETLDDTPLEAPLETVEGSPEEKLDESSSDPVQEVPVVITSVENRTQDAQAEGGSEENVTLEVQDDGRVDTEPATSAPAGEQVPPDSPVALPEAAQVDSAWPLVLRVACDVPQEIQVKRDGDTQFSQVRWPDDFAPASPVPDAGFEAGRAYRDGHRLVVFWGAEDHFSLKLANVNGVEVSINGRIRDIGRLRPGQELILDAHSAGSGTGR